MTRHVLADAFDHHVWATLEVIDACSRLTAEQQASSVPGTYGTILDTLRHIVMADSWYLFRLSDGRTTPIPDEDESRLDLDAMRAATEAHGVAWSEVLAGEPDGDRVIRVSRDDGSETHASVGLRIAQALHHGTDHRSQICTALTALGVPPPEIDLWSFGVATGRVTEIPPTASS
jgi:uncharacterized damage-inducible protein DinB